MAKKVYIGVNNVAREVKKMYIGVDGVARKVKKAYIGDENGIARLVYSAEVRYNISYVHAWTNTPVDSAFLQEYLPFLPTSASPGSYICYDEIFEQNGFWDWSPYSWQPSDSSPLYGMTEEVGVLEGYGIEGEGSQWFDEAVASGFTMPNNSIIIVLFGLPEGGEEPDYPSEYSITYTYDSDIMDVEGPSYAVEGDLVEIQFASTTGINTIKLKATTYPYTRYYYSDVDYDFTEPARYSFTMPAANIEVIITAYEPDDPHYTIYNDASPGVMIDITPTTNPSPGDTIFVYFVNWGDIDQDTCYIEAVTSNGDSIARSYRTDSLTFEMPFEDVWIRAGQN